MNECFLRWSGKILFEVPEFEREKIHLLAREVFFMMRFFTRSHYCSKMNLPVEPNLCESCLRKSKDHLIEKLHHLNGSIVSCSQTEGLVITYRSKILPFISYPNSLFQNSKSLLNDRILVYCARKYKITRILTRTNPRPRVPSVTRR